MKKATTLLLLVFVIQFAFGQIIVKNKVYKASFSNTLHEPRWVSYTLYKGGGDCDRDAFHFTNDKPELACATKDDYAGNGTYEQGHLCNAEDFAFDCEKDELTFRYYNCLPQTTNLNKGKWKSNETKVRQWSQTQKLYIICGGWFTNKKMRNVAVPDYCWKVVQSVSTKDVLFCGWFKNSTPATVEELTVPELEAKLHSHIILLK